jgi:hypothetical protein
MTENDVLAEQALLQHCTHYTFTLSGFIGTETAEAANLIDPWVELTDILFNEQREGSLKYNSCFIYGRFMPPGIIGR